MSPLSNLIGRLEAAKEGSRELDLDIICVLHPTVDREAQPRLIPEGAWRYTTSLDAALTLVPKALWVVEHQEDCFASVLPPTGDGYIGSKEISVTAHTPALALCIAALKAREARR